ncbi:hypothetical protein FACS189419_08620 [Planctomycetales bacterium]|nr:hypothetical protein FACS189419_08620 [Planctomycetales bacterium]
MKTHLFTILCIFSLSALIGCQPAPPSKDSNKTDTPPETSKTATPQAEQSAGYVEPLQPKMSNEPAAQKEEKPAETPKEDTSGEKTSAVFSEIAGKFAADAVPLPPAADLTAQIDFYVATIDKTIQELDGSTKYKEDADQIVRDANGLILVVKAVGLNAEDSKYKKSVLHIIAAAKKLESAGTFEEGQAALTGLTDSLTGKGAAAEALDWSKKTANLKPVMKAVPNLNAAIKRLGGTDKKFKKSEDKIIAGLAALAAIAQGSIANVKDTAKPDAEAEWKKECEQLRDTALKANAAAHALVDGKGDFAAFTKAFDEVNNSCHACHEIFSPEANNK